MTTLLFISGLFATGPTHQVNWTAISVLLLPLLSILGYIIKLVRTGVTEIRVGNEAINGVRDAAGRVRVKGLVADMDDVKHSLLCQDEKLAAQAVDRVAVSARLDRVEAAVTRVEATQTSMVATALETLTTHRSERKTDVATALNTLAEHRADRVSDKEHT